MRGLVRQIALTANLCSTLRALANEWSKTTVMTQFKTHLPRNTPSPLQGTSKILQLLDSGGVRIGARPFQALEVIPQMLESMNDNVEALMRVSGAEFLAWMKVLNSVTSAHYETLAWLRSRLPSYPALWPPHLVAGSPWMTDEYTWFFRWQPGERSRGYQRETAPPGVTTYLQANATQADALRVAAVALATALEDTDAWHRFASAATNLDTKSLTDLKNVRAELSRQLVAESVDAYEPRLVLRRHTFRELTVRQHMAGLTGGALEYALAFDAANALLEHAAGDVFGQLAAYGDPNTIANVSELTLFPGSLTFAISATQWLESGAIVWLEDPLIKDAVQIQALEIHYDILTGMLQRAQCCVLDGSGLAWR